jgi:hypothetical protein
MRRRDLQPLVERHFAPSFPELRPVGDLLVRVDDGIMRGFHFGRSQMNKDAVRLHVLAQALFVPSEAVELGIARELGDYYIEDRARGGEVVEAMRQRAEHDGPAFLALTADCRALADHADELTDPYRIDPAAMAEVRAYCLVRVGDVAAAREALERLAAELAQSDGRYEAEELERVRRVADALERSPQEAREVLDEWERETARALRLEAA